MTHFPFRLPFALAIEAFIDSVFATSFVGLVIRFGLQRYSFEQRRALIIPFLFAAAAICSCVRMFFRVRWRIDPEMRALNDRSLTGSLVLAYDVLLVVFCLVLGRPLLEFFGM